MRGRACLLLLALLCTAPGSEKPKLFVYIPSTIRPAVFEKQLQKECPGLNVTFYGHHRPLSKAIGQSPPAAFISLEPVVIQKRYEMFERVLEGTRDGQTWETYTLISREKIDKTRLAEMDFGVVDILSRRQMKTMLTDMLGIEEPHYTPVTKLADLLALLQVKQADCILVRKALAESYFHKRTQMNLIDLSLPKAKMGLPVLVILKTIEPEQKRALIEAITGLSQEMNSKLGVEKWREAS